MSGFPSSGKPDPRSLPSGVVALAHAGVGGGGHQHLVHGGVRCSATALDTFSTIGHVLACVSKLFSRRAGQCRQMQELSNKRQQIIKTWTACHNFQICSDNLLTYLLLAERRLFGTVVERPLRKRKVVGSNPAEAKFTSPPK
jgi:hypothetical protein